MHQPKNIGYLGVWKHVHVSTSTHHITLLDPPQTVCNDFILFTLIMFPLGLAAITIFYFLSGYWLWKLINMFYYCDYITITHLIPQYHDWSTEKWKNSIITKTTV